MGQRGRKASCSVGSGVLIRAPWSTRSTDGPAHQLAPFPRATEPPNRAVHQLGSLRDCDNEARCISELDNAARVDDRLPKYNGGGYLNCTTSPWPPDVGLKYCLFWSTRTVLVFCRPVTPVPYHFSSLSPLHRPCRRHSAIAPRPLLLLLAGIAAPLPAAFSLRVAAAPCPHPLLLLLAASSIASPSPRPCLIREKGGFFSAFSTDSVAVMRDHVVGKPALAAIRWRGTLAESSSSSLSTTAWTSVSASSSPTGSCSYAC